MSTTKAKLHHYVPRFELMNFTDEAGLLWVYDRKMKEIRQQSIHNTAAISNYYSFTTASGIVDKGLEESLSIAEGIAAPIINKINKGEWKITHKDRLEFSAYLALKWLRTPTQQKKSEALFEAVVKSEFRNLAKNEKKFNEAMDYVEEETGQTPNRKEQKEYMLDTSRYTIETTRLTSLQSMVKNLKSLYEIIFRMRWVFRYAPKGKALITSDNPFFVKPFFKTENQLGCGLLTPNTVVFIALTPRVCLTLTDDSAGTGRDILTNEMVKEVNEYIGLFSNRFVISHNDRLLKRVVERAKLDEVAAYKAIVEVQVSPDEAIKVVKD